MFRVVRGEAPNTYNVLPGKIDAHFPGERVIVAQYITMHKDKAYLLAKPFRLVAKDAGTDRVLLTITTTLPVLIVRMFSDDQVLLEDGLFLSLSFFFCFSCLSIALSVFSAHSSGAASRSGGISRCQSSPPAPTKTTASGEGRTGGRSAGVGGAGK